MKRAHTLSYIRLLVYGLAAVLGACAATGSVAAGAGLGAWLGGLWGAIAGGIGGLIGWSWTSIVSWWNGLWDGINGTSDKVDSAASSAMTLAWAIGAMLVASCLVTHPRVVEAIVGCCAVAWGLAKNAWKMIQLRVHPRAMAKRGLSRKSGT